MLSSPVVLCDPGYLNRLSTLLSRYRLQVIRVDKNEQIQGSYWGDPEAGLIHNKLYVRPDTPVHSALHEACHYVCMDSNRRAHLHTDAAGGYDEEDAVCFLQILLADYLPGYSRAQMLADMDAWGYSFRLGSSSEWFQHDAEDAREWLARNGLIDERQKPTWVLRH